MNTFMLKNKTKIYLSLLTILFSACGDAANQQTASNTSENQLTSSMQNSALPLNQSTFLKSYIKAWDELDASKRLEIIRTFWTKNSVYTDPSTIAVGPEQLNEMISNVRAQYPVWNGTHGKVYSTADNFWYAWEIRGAENKILFTGSDVIKLAENGKAIEIIGFFSM
jgi:hypothetical protein